MKVEILYMFFVQQIYVHLYSHIQQEKYLEIEERRRVSYCNGKSKEGYRESKEGYRDKLSILIIQIINKYVNGVQKTK